MSYFFNKLLFSGLLLITSVTAYAADKAIIVFDASGSMWGQLDGQTKIKVAKKTLGNLVRNWDVNKELGLLAYGHRRKGDCKDIQTLVPVGKVNKQQMISRVNRINPKGKTPISASLREAANELKFTEDQATVILISDGKETCNADPCKTAAELEKLGINFTAHVIGFDVDKETSKQLRCIADNSGGKYFSADNAQQLGEALQKVVEQPKMLTIKAVDEENGGLLNQTIDWKLINQDTEEVISITGNGTGKDIRIAGKEPLENAITSGKWLVSGSSGIYSGQTSIEISGDENQLVKVNMNKQLPKAKINAPDKALTGTEITVSWEAPDVEAGKINLQLADDKPDFYANPSIYTKNKKEASMRLPSEAGDYRLRFFSLQDKKSVLSERSLTLTPAEIAINAPDEAGAGTEIDVIWLAPNVIDLSA